MPVPVLIGAATTLDGLATDVPGVRRGARRGVLAGGADPRLRQQPSLPGTWARPAAPSRCGCPTTVALALLSAPARWRSARANRTGLPAATAADGGRRSSATPSRCTSTAARRPSGEPRRSSTCDRRSRGCCALGALSVERAQDVLAAARLHRDRATTTRRGPGVPVREYLLVFLVAAAVTYLLTPHRPRVRPAHRRGREVRDRDVHADPMPYLGGAGDARRPGRGVRRGPPAAVPLAQRPGGLPRRPHRADRGSDDLRARRPRRPLRARRADQARAVRCSRPGSWCSTASSLPLPDCPAAASSPSTRRGRPAHGVRGRRHDQRGELRRRARRPRRRRGRHRRDRVLRLLLPARRASTTRRWPRPGRC